MANESESHLDQTIDRKGAAVKFPPPLIFVLLIFVAGGIDYLLPLPLGVSEPYGALGVLSILLGLAIAIAVNFKFRRAGTAIEPWKPTSALVTTGLYRWSRNPIYAGFCLVNIGIGIVSDSIWIALSFIPSAILVFYIAIAKEERYLEQKFGQEYLNYKQRVRRWI